MLSTDRTLQNMLQKGVAEFHLEEEVRGKNGEDTIHTEPTRHRPNLRLLVFVLVLAQLG